MNKRIAALTAVLLVAAFVIAITFSKKVKALVTKVPTVEITTVGAGAAQSDILAEGSIVPIAQSNVTVLPAFEGEITKVNVDIGDHVRKGQALAVLDPISQENLYEQTHTGVVSAEAHYQLVLHPYRPEEIAREQVKIEGLLQRVREAETEMKQLHNGYRPEQIAASKAILAAAQETLRQGQSTLDYNKALYAKELIPKADLEQSESAVVVDKDLVAQHEQGLRLLEEGVRWEQKEKAQEALVIAQDAYKQEVATYHLMLMGSRPEAIEAAAAALDKAREIEKLQAVVVERQMVRAPISGVIVERDINPGEVAAPDTQRSEMDSAFEDRHHSLFVIADDSKVAFRANIDARYYHLVHPGDTATITFESQPGKEFTGRVTRINPVINPDSTRPVAVNSPSLPLTFEIWVTLPNTDESIVMGEGGLLAMSNSTSGTVLPQGAITPFSSGNGLVYVESNGIVKVREIKYGEIVNGHVNVLSGLKTGDRVVISTPYQLKDGLSVHAVEASGSNAAPME